MSGRRVDAIIIGGGPAGLSAAITLSRNKWKTLLLDKPDEGFLARFSNVGCFPGFPEEVSGTDLISRMKKQAENFDCQIKTTAAEKVNFESNPKEITASGSEVFAADVVVIAAGSFSRTNYLPGEKEFLGRGVSHDILSDAPSSAKETIAIVGKNRSAADGAMAACRYAEKVHFIIPSSKLECEEVLQKKIHSEQKIEMFFSTSLKKINGTARAFSVTVFSGGQEKELPVSTVFILTHDYQSASSFLQNSVKTGEHGEILVDEKFRASAENVFACGDILCGRPQNPIVSMAQGIVAAKEADKCLRMAYIKDQK